MKKQISSKEGTSLKERSSTPSLVSRLVREHVRPYLKRLAFAVLCMGLVAAATATNAWLMQPMLDKVFLERDQTMLWLIPLIVLIVAIVKGLATYGQSVTMNYIGQKIISRVQMLMFAHLMKADISYFTSTSTGKLISRFNNDANLLRAAVSNALTGIARDALTVIFLIIVMFERDWLLALIAFFVFPVAIFPIVRLGRRMRKVSANTQVQMGELTTLLDETFRGARHVRAYGMEKYEIDRAGNIIETIFNLVNKAARVRSISHPIMETLGGIAIAIVIFYGGSQVLGGETTPGTFFSFITALLLAYEPMKRLANLNANLQEGLAAAQRIFDLIDQEPNIRNSKTSKNLGHVTGIIKLKNVGFQYKKGQDALLDINIEVLPGETVALVGPSGAGKSTILNLIPRFYDCTRGKISIDGYDIRDLTLESLRSNIALVTQDITLFDDTVRANILYGRAGATEKDIISAAKGADAHNFITNLEKSYETHVGGRGLRLSGGQQQRIAIARAMLKNAPILLLDEATSALDSETERQVQRAINKLTRNRTTIVIAHRLSTVTNADRIYVMDNGRIVETGTHLELLKCSGPYAKLYAVQFADQKNQEQSNSTPING
ncbi:MAG: lipid A export permease/ATP-binding protein MsbA [Rhodospirillaceae bacterium]|nr:lipid A export permease/ATP-binding protein MsbA [Rhodospirillaceae bacterium]